MLLLLPGVSLLPLAVAAQRQEGPPPLLLLP
jgi:hypothetical protein